MPKYSNKENEKDSVQSMNSTVFLTPTLLCYEESSLSTEKEMISCDENNNQIFSEDNSYLSFHRKIESDTKNENYVNCGVVFVADADAALTVSSIETFCESTRLDAPIFVSLHMLLGNIMTYHKPIFDKNIFTHAIVYYKKIINKIYKNINEDNLYGTKVFCNNKTTINFTKFKSIQSSIAITCLVLAAKYIEDQPYTNIMYYNTFVNFTKINYYHNQKNPNAWRIIDDFPEFMDFVKFEQALLWILDFDLGVNTRPQTP